MSSLDSVFLRLETPQASLHIGSIAIMDGPVASRGEVTALFASRLADVPRYRQIVREVPFRLGRPVWTNDPHFDITYHVRRTAVPRPGSDRDLDALVGRLMSQPLRRDRPLWEVWVVEGLAHGRWAIVSKVHHCMVDGIAGTDLMEAFVDRAPDVPMTRASESSGPDASSSRSRLAVSMALAPWQRARAVSYFLAESVRHPRVAARSTLLQLRGFTSYVALARPGPGSSLTGNLSATRVWRHTRIPIEDVRTVRRALGGTLNDVVVACVTRGFRELLRARGESTTQLRVRALIPVSVRAATHRGRTDNEITAVVATLPTDEPTLLGRLAAVRSELDRLKASGEAQAGVFLASAGDLVPGPLLSLGLSGLFRIPQPFVTTVVTNVPGPREERYLAGRRMVCLYPYVPIADRIRIGVAVLSYCDVLYVGVTAERDHADHVDALIDGIRSEITALREYSRDREGAGNA